MVDHDNPAEDDVGPAPIEPTGPRRSTYTPPQTPRDVDETPMTSDDDLASALAEEMERAVHTGTIPIGDGGDDDGDGQGSFVDDLPGPPVAESPAAEPPVAEPLVPGTPSQRPTRQSMPVDVLAATLEAEARKPGSTLDVMAQLEQQLHLREKEAQEFGEWETSMRAVGTPEAIAEVENARSEFRDLLSRVSESEPVAVPAPPPEAEPEWDAEVEPTHTFRLDEALESDLDSAPAPMTAPISDIPPPPGHELAAPRPTPATPCCTRIACTHADRRIHRSLDA